MRTNARREDVATIRVDAWLPIATAVTVEVVHTCDAEVAKPPAFTVVAEKNANPNANAIPIKAAIDIFRKTICMIIYSL